LNILVVGNGSREHAIAWKLSQSSLVENVYVAPGNAGTAQIATNLSLEQNNFEALADAAVKYEIDLTMIGPETPLSQGIVDHFQIMGQRIFGPTQSAARIESSKVFAKNLMRKYGIPTGDFAVFQSFDTARDYVKKQNLPLVIKADGLAAGKGVIIAYTQEEALEALESFMVEKVFGDAGRSVLIEEFLSGREVSVFGFTDGVHCSNLIAACDYKRAYDYDLGPNTGGMGSYSPPSFWNEELSNEIRSKIMLPTIKALASEKSKYKGILYGGVILTSDGPKVLEFNCRFGDPETQVVLPLLVSDMPSILTAVIEERLDEIDISWSNESCVGIVVTSAGYPANFDIGYKIDGLDNVDEEGIIFHGGTKNADLPNDGIVTNGGRVLTVVSKADDMNIARSKAYQNVETIRFEGASYRNDIALNI
tara:strand:+ start:4252 stop:5517 length:1266 start_codon:yes stop_codon:yes gene_type:complete